MAIGSVGVPRADQERGGAELADRHREGEAGADEQGAADHRQVDLPPDPPRRRRRAAPRPRAGAGRCARSTGSTARTTNGMATRAWAIGTRIHVPRRSSGRPVDRDEQPEADGHGRRAERQHQAGVEQAPAPRPAPVGDGGRRQPAEHDGEERWRPRRSAATCRWRRAGGRPGSCRRPRCPRAR